MTDITGLREDKRPQSSTIVHALLDRLEAAESEALEQARLNGMGSEREAALLSKLEAAEKERDALRTAVQHETDCVEAAKAEIKALRAKIEAAENDAAHQKALAASALRVAEGWERKCGELRAEVIYWKEQKEPGAAGWRALARILQAKIDAMEKQEPIGGMLEVSPHNYELRWYRPVPFGAKLYTLPGAQPQLNEIKITLKRALELSQRETWTGVRKHRSWEDQREEQQCWNKVWSLLGAKGESE